MNFLRIALLVCAPCVINSKSAECQSVKQNLGHLLEQAVPHIELESVSEIVLDSVSARVVAERLKVPGVAPAALPAVFSRPARGGRISDVRQPGISPGSHVWAKPRVGFVQVDSARSNQNMLLLFITTRDARASGTYQVTYRRLPNGEWKFRHATLVVIH